MNELSPTNPQAVQETIKKEAANRGGLFGYAGGPAIGPTTYTPENAPDIAPLPGARFFKPIKAFIPKTQNWTVAFQCRE